MNSKEKTFVGILVGATVILAGGLYLLAGRSATRIENAKEQHTSLSNEIKKMQGLPLFPTSENLAGKEKDLLAFQADSAQLAEKLRTFQPIAIDNTDAQTFTNTLVKTADATIKAYAAAGLAVDGEKGALPRGFYLGFESYTSTPAQEGATGILAYQLATISEAHQILASAKPVKLLNFMREPLPEEKNGAYTPISGVPYRTLSFEISFAGPESAMRDFINGLQSSKSHFYVIRSMRIENEKQTGPKASDVKFDAKPAKPAAANFFDSLEGFDPAAPAPAPGAEGAAPVAPAAPEPAPKASSELILKQVLGDENIEVFLRIDVLLFDAPAEPKP